MKNYSREWENGSGYLSPTESKACKHLHHVERWTDEDEERAEVERNEAQEILAKFLTYAERKGYTLVSVVLKKKNGTGKKFKLLDGRAKETRH